MFTLKEEPSSDSWCPRVFSPKSQIRRENDCIMFQLVQSAFERFFSRWSKCHTIGRASCFHDFMTTDRKKKVWHLIFTWLREIMVNNEDAHLSMCVTCCFLSLSYKTLQLTYFNNELQLWCLAAHTKHCSNIVEQVQRRQGSRVQLILSHMETKFLCE